MKYPGYYFKFKINKLKFDEYFNKLEFSNINTKKYNNIDFLLHNEIISKCSELYLQKLYAEAVEKSFKIVKDRLRKLTGFEKGSDAFGSGKLYIKGASAPNVDDDFNKAVKYLTMSIDMFRNEKSHTSEL